MLYLIFEATFKSFIWRGEKDNKWPYSRTKWKIKKKKKLSKFTFPSCSLRAQNLISHDRPFQKNVFEISPLFMWPYKLWIMISEKVSVEVGKAFQILGPRNKTASRIKNNNNKKTQKHLLKWKEVFKVSKIFIIHLMFNESLLNDRCCLKF